MSLILVAALALTSQPQPDTVIPRAELERKVVVVNRTDPSKSVELSEALATAFASMDKNKDRFIAGDELTNNKFRVIRTVIREGQTTPAPATTTLTRFDTDGDKRVSEAEFQAGMAGITRPRS